MMQAMVNIVCPRRSQHRARKNWSVADAPKTVRSALGLVDPEYNSDRTQPTARTIIVSWSRLRTATSRITVPRSLSHLRHYDSGQK